MNQSIGVRAYQFTVADERPATGRHGGRELDPFKKAVIETATTGKSLRLTGDIDDAEIKRLVGRLGGVLWKRGMVPRIARGADQAVYVWAEPRVQPETAEPAAATTPAPPRESAPGKYDTDVLDCLHLAGKKGSVKPSEIARRLSRGDKQADVDKLTQAVWGVLQRFVSQGRAVKLAEGGYRLASTAE